MNLREEEATRYIFNYETRQWENDTVCRIDIMIFLMMMFLGMVEIRSNSVR